MPKYRIKLVMKGARRIHNVALSVSLNPCNCANHNLSELKIFCKFYIFSVEFLASI